MKYVVSKIVLIGAGKEIAGARGLSDTLQIHTIYETNKHKTRIIRNLAGPRTRPAGGNDHRFGTWFSDGESYSTGDRDQAVDHV